MHTDCEKPPQSFFVCSQSAEGVFKNYQFNFPLEIQDQDRLRYVHASRSNQTKTTIFALETFLGEIVDNPGMKNAHLLMSVMLDH